MRRRDRGSSHGAMESTAWQRVRRSLLLRGGLIVFVPGLLALYPALSISLNEKAYREYAIEEGFSYVGDTQLRLWLSAALVLLGLGLTCVLAGLVLASRRRHATDSSQWPDVRSLPHSCALPDQAIRQVRRFAPQCVYVTAALGAIAWQVGLSRLFRSGGFQMQHEYIASEYGLLLVGAALVAFATATARAKKPLGAMRMSVLYSGVGIAMYGVVGDSSLLCLSEATLSASPVVSSLRAVVGTLLFDVWFFLSANWWGTHSPLGYAVSILVTITTLVLIVTMVMAHRLETRRAYSGDRWPRLLLRVFASIWCALIVWYVASQVAYLGVVTAG